MTVLPAVPDREVLKDLDAVFNQARKQFLDSLTTEEQARFSGCSSSQALLDEVKKFEVVAKSKQRGLRLVRKIQSMSDNLSPYFKIIEIFCGAHPEYANITWGAFKLILQLASNYATFFEKLCESIWKLSLALPRYEDISKLLLQSKLKGSMSYRLQNSMTDFYSDMFSFFQAVARVLSNKKGTLRRTPLVIGDLLWKPFHVRFRETIKRMDLHQNVLKEEIQLTSIASIHAIFQDQSETVDNFKEYLEIKFDEIQRTQDAREDGTAEWLFSNQKFGMWKVASGGRSLWVEGNPGWGKTVLAASTVEELRDSPILGSGSLPVVCYYFFYQNNDQKASRIGAYRALVTQLFQQCHQIKEIYDIFSIAKNGFRTTASEHDLLDILKIALAQLSNVFFVVDGIDECEEKTKFLRELCGFTSSTCLKTILFSRPNVSSLRHYFQEESRAYMTREVLNKDIAIFLDNELLSLKQSSLLPADLDMISARNVMLERADGISYTSRRMFEMSKSTPEKLEDMYLKIFNHIKSMDPASRQLASRIFMWVGYGKTLLNPEQITEVVWRDQFKPSIEESDDIDHKIIISCCGIIERRQNQYLHFIHLTARDFILSPRLCSDSGLPFVHPKTEAAFEMSQGSISYMCLSVPARPLGGDIHKSLSLDELEAKHPFLQYAAQYWAEHAIDALPTLDLLAETSSGYDTVQNVAAVLDKFTASKLNLMVWVETLYMYGLTCPTDIVNGLAAVLAVAFATAQFPALANVQRTSKNFKESD